MFRMNCVKKLKYGLQFVALIVFTVQVVIAMMNYAAGPTMVAESLMNISALDRPVHISMCKMDQYNYSRSKLLGYSSSTPFMAGESSNKSFLSWTGANGSLTFEDTIRHLYNSKNDSSYASRNTTSHFFLPFGLCTTVTGHLKDILDNDKRSIKFYMKSPGKYIIFISDDAAILNFQLPYPLMTGERIKISIPEIQDSNHRTRQKEYYSVQIFETVDNSGKGLCTNYPTQKFTSYANCVEKENRRMILPVLGCMVPWMSDKDTCRTPIPRLPAHQDVISWLKQTYQYAFTGFNFRSMACRLPCHLLSSHAKYQYAHKRPTAYDRITLYFEETMQVKTIGPAYGLDSLIVEIGSSLGLWLGISVVGIFDVLVLTLSKATMFLRSSFYIQ